jgi:hypothetical protein
MYFSHGEARIKEGKLIDFLDPNLFLTLIGSSTLPRSLEIENLVEGHILFLNKFVKIPRRSVIVCFLSLSAKADLNFSPFEISCS